MTYERKKPNELAILRDYDLAVDLNGKPRASLADDVLRPRHSDDFAARQQQAFAIALDAGRQGGGDVVLPRGARVAQIVQVGVGQLQVQFIDAPQRAQAHELAAQIDDDALADHFV